jgi:Calcineurin-like phosphoesterase.
MMTEVLGRRAFIRHNVLFLAAGLVSAGRSASLSASEAASPKLRFGLITDLHYADKPSAGNRQYRQTTEKLSEAIEAFQRENVAFVAELGDFIDSAPDLETELGYLKTIQRQLADGVKNRHYVLGNHCVERLTKDEFLGEVGQKSSYYSFDQGDIHFVILDACFRPDGVPYGRRNSDWREAFIPQEELEWLESDLATTDLPVIVFAHQRLDVDNHYAPRNVAQVRKVLESSGKVRVVFQGHSHANDYREVNGIHYCTLVAMIEGKGPERNGYSIVSVNGNGDLTLTGFRDQKNYHWPAKQAAAVGS